MPRDNYLKATYSTRFLVAPSGLHETYTSLLIDLLFLIASTTRESEASHGREPNSSADLLTKDSGTQHFSLTVCGRLKFTAWIIMHECSYCMYNSQCHILRSPALGGSTTPTASSQNLTSFCRSAITSSAFPHTNSQFVTPVKPNRFRNIPEILHSIKHCRIWNKTIYCWHYTNTQHAKLERSPFSFALTLASSTACSTISTPTSFLTDMDCVNDRHTWLYNAQNYNCHTILCIILSPWQGKDQ